MLSGLDEFARAWCSELRHRMSRPIPPILVFLFLVPFSSVQAGSQEEKLMQERTAREEAAARPCDHLFRVMILPARPDSTYAFVTKIYLTQSSGAHEPTGCVTIKVRFPHVGFAERSRTLKRDEIALVWRIFSEEEIFSLPAKQKESPEPSLMVMDGSMVIFSHYERRTHRTEEVTRGISTSRPAARAVEDLAKPFEDLVTKLEKVDPFR
jgi:hypothetical protein